MSIGYLSQNGMNKVFEQFVQSDPNLNQYGFGQLYNENGEPKAKQVYPGMWVNPVNTLVEEYQLTRNYQILIYDIPFIDDSGSNQNHIISDCEEIAFRLIRFLKDKSEIFDVISTPTISPFTDRFLDDVCGVIIDVAVVFNAEWSNCGDPNYPFDIQSNTI